MYCLSYSNPLLLDPRLDDHFFHLFRCDQMINDTGGEAEAWANVGRQFWLTEKLYASHNYSYQKLLDAGTHCFLMAAYVCELLLSSFYLPPFLSLLPRLPSLFSLAFPPSLPSSLSLSLS